MRISEKTLELTFCSQFQINVLPSLLIRHPMMAMIPMMVRLMPIIWFGLTQRQEAIAGFDACAKIGGRLIILQFKASNNIRPNGSRRFKAPHEQMQSLITRAGSSRRSIFYVLPNIGTTLDIVNNPWILDRTWLLDVTDIPSIQPPTKQDGSLRKNGEHYIDLDTSSSLVSATIRSEPMNVKVIQAGKFWSQYLDQSNGLKLDQRSGDELWQDFFPISRNSIAGILPPP